MKYARPKSNLISTTSDTTSKTFLHGTLEKILGLAPFVATYPFKEKITLCLMLTLMKRYLGVKEKCNGIDGLKEQYKLLQELCQIKHNYSMESMTP